MRRTTKRHIRIVIYTMTVLIVIVSTYNTLFRQRMETFGYSEMFKLNRNKIIKDDMFHVPKAPDETEILHDSYINTTVPSWRDLNSKFDHVLKGGRSKPIKPSHKIVIIVPYRDRPFHLKLFLNHMHTFLKLQNVEYVIYVVEMGPENLFNRGSLSNAGFLEVIKREKTPCVIFHDVDMLPTNNDNLYFCGRRVRHYAHAVEQYRFKLNYKTYIGGVIAFPPRLFLKVNGYSNLFYGWGGEDDDLFNRAADIEQLVSRRNLLLSRGPGFDPRSREISFRTLVSHHWVDNRKPKWDEQLEITKDKVVVIMWEIPGIYGLMPIMFPG